MMMMSEDGESNTPTPTPTTAAQKWEDKILYLTFQGNTCIWGFKPFKAALSKTTVRGHRYSYEVDVPETVCNLNIQKDGKFPVGMSFFQVDDQVCMVGGGETNTTAYIFDPMKPPSSSSGLLDDYNGLRLHYPMPSPMVAKIEGKIYMLSLYEHPIPYVDEIEECFRVLEKCKLYYSPSLTSTFYHWRTLPTPPFYSNISSDMLFEGPTHPRKMLAVVGHTLYMYADTRTYSFDTRTRKWQETENARRYARPQYSTTLSRLITSSGSSLKKKITTNAGRQQAQENKDCSYPVVVRVDLHNGGPSVFVSLVNREGIRSHEQRIDDALPPPCPDIVDVKAIEVPEDEDDDHLSSTFCVVFPTCRDFLFLSAVRVSLKSPMVVRTSEDGIRYLSAWGDDKPKSAGIGLDNFLKVEVLEKRKFAMDADFGYRGGPFDGLFAKDEEPFVT